MQKTHKSIVWECIRYANGEMQSAKPLDEMHSRFAVVIQKTHKSIVCFLVEVKGVEPLTS